MLGARQPKRGTSVLAVADERPVTPMMARMRQALALSGSSARALSLKAQLSHSVVGQIAGGQIENPTGEVIAAIAMAVPVDAAWLGFGIGEPRPPAASTSPPTEASGRSYDLDLSPWRQLAATNASFDAWAGGRYRRAADKDVTVAGLNYAARSLPRHSEKGGAQVVYRAKEMERLALIGEALDRGEDVDEEPEPPPPPPLPKAPPKPSLVERAAKIEAEAKERRRARR